MPRPQKERKIGNVPAGRIREGLLLIRNGESIRKASKNVGVSFATLKRYHHKFKDAPSLEDLTSSQLEPNYSVNTIFTAEQEITLKNYITHCALLFYGLTAKESRRLAYQCGKINNLKMPLSWEAKEMAGKDWLIAFRRRHNITLKKPEACSLARATAFNRNNVDKYFDNLENIIARSPHFSDGTRIFNLDETSTTTVQKPLGNMKKGNGMVGPLKKNVEPSGDSSGGASSITILRKKSSVPRNVTKCEVNLGKNTKKRKLHEPGCSGIEEKKSKMIECPNCKQKIDIQTEILEKEANSPALEESKSPCNTPISGPVSNTPVKQNLKKQLALKTALAQERLIKIKKLMRINKSLKNKNLTQRDIIENLESNRFGDSNSRPGLSGLFIVKN